MKRYLVFTYYVGRAFGGAKDFLDGFETVEDALDNILKEANRYYQIVDQETFQIVKEGLAIYKDFTPENFVSGSSESDEEA